MDKKISKHKTNEADIYRNPIKLMPPLDEVIGQINKRLKKLEKLYAQVAFLDRTLAGLQAKLAKHGIHKEDYTRL